ncbi:TetR/AcrR family transcriptional regulator [Evansella sp. AB-rgal1]|uniref:TetR/AcrR family transcriptional regulator n=1 Tax=Evansella sp. AB-rgal1 TaxID=3242696 RepID=UPI00359EE33A
MEQLKDDVYTTEDYILHAAIDLMEKKGFKAVTTKEIAAKAGFSEMTLFRHFGTKRKLLETAVEKYSYLLDMKHILKSSVTYDLETDLKLVSETYHKYLEQNEKIVLLAFQERYTYPKIAQKAAENPKMLKEYLIDYFIEMQRQNKMMKVDPEIHAMNFLWLNLGYFMAKFLSGNTVSIIQRKDFIDESVKTFVRGIRSEKSLTTR